MIIADHSNMGDALVYTASAYYFIGFILLVVSVWIWNTSSYKRAFLFGPYITPSGVRLLLANWPFVFLFGAFIFSCAAEHHAHWLFAHGKASAKLVRFLGYVEAIISVWTAGSILFVMGRAWFRK